MDKTISNVVHRALVDTSAFPLAEVVTKTFKDTIVMQMRLVAIQSLLNFGVMTVYSGHPKGNFCN